MQLHMSFRIIYAFHVEWVHEPQELTLRQKMKARKEYTVLSKPFLLEMMMCFIADHLVTLRGLDVMINTLSLLLNI